MKEVASILSSYDYKKRYLPYLDLAILSNTNSLQIYKIEEYLTGIVKPVSPYRTAFSFIIFITQGEFEQLISFQHYRIAPGECLHVKQGLWTATQYLSDDVKGFIIFYESDIFTQYLLMHDKKEEIKYMPYYKLDYYDTQALTASMLLLYGELGLHVIRPSVYVPIFYSILSRLNCYTVNYTFSSRDLEIAYRFKELVIDSHIREKSVSYYADSLCLSENYLNRCIKTVLGRSAKQLINEVNVAYAKLLLINTTRDIAAIAFELGYPSPSYFSKFFRKEMGVSPNEYRRIERANIIHRWE
ncbi:helix-turn-helix domain-containing protein [Myroides sp. DF42-4-2]|uniref:helix-turn-helix domain-containing protein n=1 Tax=unclassified Myroides TaxID=2642485 RepID=UPI002574FC95|nr:helix-turn-helix domain-containing protein [Myroides sp. DF42-4-2]MDM1406789.1 helix-turn-helix domain-containing protein [Myroides sp. DF42-4-2]